MRTLSRALVVAAGLLSIGVLSSSVFANSLPVGSFTLSHPTMWNGTMMPAGEYQFKMTRTQSDTNMLVISGQKQTLTLMVFAQSACQSCNNEALKMTVQGNSRIVTSLDLPGYHLEFKTPRLENAKETVADPSPWVEQIPLSVNDNK